jgi:hypothetical protein
MQTSTFSPLVIQDDCVECRTSTIALSSAKILSFQLLFTCLFSATATMKDKNKFILLTFQHYIKLGRLDVIDEFFRESALADLHPSLIKSALVMTQDLDQHMHESRIRATQIFEAKIAR